MDAQSSTIQNRINAPLLLGVKEVCSALGLGRTAIYGLINSGRLPMPLKLGGKVCWRRDEILRWIAADCPPRKRWLTMRGQR
jgi:excisionase family DNA binding protein